MDIEKEALALGWVPQEQFRGDSAKWVDAETFVSRGKEIMPILRKNNEKLLGEVESLKGTIGTMQASLSAATEAMSEFKQYHEDTAKRAYQKAVNDLKAQKVEAMENGEHRKVVEIDDALRELDKEAPKAMRSGNTETPAPAPAQVPNPMQDPVFAQWESENRSWLIDPDKQAYANSIAQYLNATSKMRGREFLDKVKEEVEKRYSTNTPQKVEGGGAQPRTSGRSYSDLPADAKAACDRMGSKLVGDSKAYKSVDEWRKQYVKDYFA
jgi:hypothetical protein